MSKDQLILNRVCAITIVVLTILVTTTVVGVIHDRVLKREIEAKFSIMMGELHSELSQKIWTPGKEAEAWRQYLSTGSMPDIVGIKNGDYVLPVQQEAAKGPDSPAQKGHAP